MYLCVHSYIYIHIQYLGRLLRVVVHMRDVRGFTPRLAGQEFPLFMAKQGSRGSLQREFVPGMKAMFSSSFKLVGSPSI